MLSIVTYPNPVLTKPCKLVTIFDEHLQKFVDSMLETMRFNHGIGLAANQVGISQSIFVMEIEHISYAFINPEIVTSSTDVSSYQEGCLSFPSLQQETFRPKVIELKWQDTIGNIHQKEFSGLEAICIQHELDHLKGKTFLDLLSPLKKNFALKKYLKMKNK